MSIQDEHQCWAFLHNSHARVCVAVDAPLMTFGLTKPTLQVEIVLGPINFIVAYEQPGLKTCHQFPQVLLVLIFTGLVLGSKRCELLLALGVRTVRGIKCGRYLAYFLGLLADRFLSFRDGIQAAFDAIGQTF